MKIYSILSILILLSGVVLFAGCTSTSPPAQVTTIVPTETVVPTTSVTLSPTPTAVPYPNALALNTYASYGKYEVQGKATVLRYFMTPTYNWTSPTFNSAREQAAASGPFDTQRGFNMEKAPDGTTFLFIFVRVTNTGTKAVYAPSAQQFTVVIDGKLYSYTPVHSSDVVIDKIFGTQYDYQIGPGGTVGYLQPGDGKPHLFFSSPGRTSAQLIVASSFPGGPQYGLL